MKIVIDLELTSAQKKVIKSAVVTATVIGSLGFGVALADPVAFKADGTERLSADKMNANFKDVSDRLKAVEAGKASVTKNGASYSLGATYCGSTAPTTGKIGSGGFVATKAICEKGTSCGASATAHMCTAEEMIRSASLGLTTPLTGWFSTGVQALAGPSNYVSDCNGWSSVAAAEYGPVWSGEHSGGVAWGDRAGCDGARPVLCCD